MYDFTSFFSAVAENGVFVLAAVIGLTTFVGEFGVEGKWKKLSALLIGLVFGGCFQVAALGTPDSFAGWFSIVMYGIIMGLTASGLYDTGKKLMGAEG